MCCCFAVVTNPVAHRGQVACRVTSCDPKPAPEAQLCAALVTSARLPSSSGSKKTLTLDHDKRNRGANNNRHQNQGGAVSRLNRGHRRILCRRTVDLQTSVCACTPPGHEHERGRSRGGRPAAFVCCIKPWVDHGGRVGNDGCLRRCGGALARGGLAAGRAAVFAAGLAAAGLVPAGLAELALAAEPARRQPASSLAQRRNVVGTCGRLGSSSG